MAPPPGAATEDRKKARGAGSVGKRIARQERRFGMDDRLLGGVEPPSAIDVAQLNEQREEKSFVQSQATTMETGLLSIAVDLPIEGAAHALRCTLLGDRVSPQYRFFFRTAPTSKPGWAMLLEFLLTLCAGIALARCMWAGWRRPLALYGVVVPLALMLGIDRYLGKPLHVDLLFLVPLAFFATMAARALFARARREMVWWADLVESIRGMRRRKKTEAEAGPTATPTPPPLPEEKK
jgi:hypothetical protein